MRNSGTSLDPTLAIAYVAWANDTTPPTRSNQDGVLVRNGNPGQRLVGVVRTTSAGTSTIDLGGTITGANSANFPRMYLANLYNLYDARAVYFFGSSWSTQDGGVNQFLTPPASVYPQAPRISFVQASETLVTAFLDIYNNWIGNYSVGSGPIAYVAPGINSTYPPSDAFYGETQYNNSTAGSQWARALPQGKQDIYYLYLSFAGNSEINEHPAHGMIVTLKS